MLVFYFDILYCKRNTDLMQEGGNFTFGDWISYGILESNADSNQVNQILK